MSKYKTIGEKKDHDRLHEILRKRGSLPLGLIHVTGNEQYSYTIPKKDLDEVMAICERHPHLALSVFAYSEPIIPSWARTPKTKRQFMVLELLIFQQAPVESIIKFCEKCLPSELNLPQEPSLNPMVAACTMPNTPKGLIPYLAAKYPTRVFSPDPDFAMRRLLEKNHEDLADYEALQKVHPISDMVVAIAVVIPTIDSPVKEFIFQHRPAGMSHITLVNADFVPLQAAPVFKNFAEVPFPLTSLLFYEFSWDESTWMNLVSLLAEDGCGIRELRIHLTHRQRNAMKARFIPRLLEKALVTNKSVEYFKITIDNPPTPRGIWSFLRPPQPKPVPGDVTDVVATMIRSAKSLKQISINNANVRVSSLVEGLKSSKTLRRLSTYGGAIISETDAHSLARALKENTTLKDTDVVDKLSSNNVDVQMIKYYLLRNWYEPNKARDPEMTKKQFVDLLLRAGPSTSLHHMSAQLEILRENPGLWCNRVSASPMPPVSSPGPSSETKKSPMVRKRKFGE